MNPSVLFSDLRDFAIGHHVLGLVDTDEERNELLLSWLRTGVELGQAVACLVGPQAADRLATLLLERAPDLAAARARGQLKTWDLPVDLEASREVFANCVLERLERARKAAAEGDFPVCRVLLEPDRPAFRASDALDARHIEARVSGFFRRWPALGLCLLDRRRVPAAAVLDALRVHDMVILQGVVHPNPSRLPALKLDEEPSDELEVERWLEGLRGHRQLLVSLEGSEARYRELFESLIAGFALHEMVYDEQGQAVDYRFLEVNPAFEALTGLEASAIIGRTVLEVIPGLERTWIERYARVAETGEQVRFRQYSTPLDRHYEVVSYRPGPGRFATVFSDVTEIVEAERKRQEAERRLYESQKLDSLGLLAGGIAHDFNNMLMGVLGNASLALHLLPGHSPARECLEDIEIAATNAADLAKQLLAYSGRGRFVVEPVDVGALVQEMAKLLDASIPKNVRIRYHLDSQASPVRADVSQVRQVLMNLILNASQAIGERSGIITVATSAMHCDGDYLSTTFTSEELEPGSYVYLEITDTGEGMDAATQKRIFDPFFTTKDHGRGLGLAATLGIIRGHRGAIKVYSELGRGTTFKVLLPAHVEGMPVPVQEREPDEAWRASGIALVVDDEEPVRRVASRILEYMGFEVLTAEDGREAVAIFESRHRDIRFVLLDMMMPRMGGDRVFTELRRIDPEVCVVLTSGYNEQDAVDRFVGRGLAGFIQKPYRKEDLERMVREALA